MRDREHRARLEPFGNISAMLDTRALEYVRSLSDVDLGQLAESVEWPTRSNVWCHIYQAAQWLRPYVQQELRNRARARAAA